MLQKIGQTLVMYGLGSWEKELVLMDFTGIDVYFFHQGFIRKERGSILIARIPL